MRHLKQHLLLFCFILVSFTSLCQNPAHFFIGQEEFSNTQIYSLKYHPNGLLYVATNYGLYVYKNGEFTSVPLRGNKNTSSLFSLRLDSKNDLYCSTIAGEIFKLRKDSLEVYSTMPKKYQNKYAASYVFDDKDDIVMISGSVAIYKDHKWMDITNEKDKSATINGLNPESILFPSGENSTIKELKDGVVQELEVSKNKMFPSSVHTFPAYYDEHLLGFTNYGFLLDYTTSKRYKISNEKKKVHQTQDGRIWFLSGSKGLNKLEHTTDSFSLSNTYFKDLFISTITVSEDGVIFLGTFGHGVIVIPSIHFFEYKTKLGRVEGITSIPNSKMTVSLKNLIKENKKLDLICNGPENESILIGLSKVFFDSNFDFGFNEIDRGLLTQEQSSFRTNGGVASIKDLQKVDKATQLLATSKGLLKIGKGLEHTNWLKNGTGDLYWLYTKTQFRCKTVGYVSSTKNIYYTNYGFLHNIDGNGQDSKVLFRGEPIKCSDIFSMDTMAVCATNKNGILFIKNGSVVKQLSNEQGLMDSYVKQIIIHNNKMYITSRSTFQIYNLKNEHWETFGRYQNVIKGAVSNMLISNQKIWLVSGNKVLALPLSSMENTESFSFELNEVILGNTSFNLSDEITVPYNKNRFALPLDFRGLLYENQINIEYRLNNSEWNSIEAISKSIVFNALEPNTYQLDIRLNNNGVYSHHQEVEFTITPAFWQRWWFYALSVLMIILIIALVAFWQIKSIRKKNNELIEKQKLKASLLDSELKTLRSQMNPHFIFNALNSIQDLILKEDTDASYDYVVLFANLVRSTLNYSNKDFIPIEKELEFLGVYLKLEKLRFGDEFTYQINYIGTEDIQVPSLIVQPFIENALIHGLLHKKGNKNLTINFELSDQLVCVITDNGVGRERSNEIKKRQGNHKSFALEAIEKRLSILSNKDEGYFGFDVTDLYENNSPSGTQIVVTMPYKFLY